MSLSRDLVKFGTIGMQLKGIQKYPAPGQYNLLQPKNKTNFTLK